MPRRRFCNGWHGSQICPEIGQIRVRHPRIGRIRKCRKIDRSIRPFSIPHRADEILKLPLADTEFRIGCDVWWKKGTKRRLQGATAGQKLTLRFYRCMATGTAGGFEQVLASLLRCSFSAVNGIGNDNQSQYRQRNATATAQEFTGEDCVHASISSKHP